MAIERRSATQPTRKSNGNLPKATAKTRSRGRGTRGDGSGSTTPRLR